MDATVVFGLVFLYVISAAITGGVALDMDHSPHVIITMAVFWPLFLVITFVRGFVDYWKGK